MADLSGLRDAVYGWDGCFAGGEEWGAWGACEEGGELIAMEMRYADRLKLEDAGLIILGKTNMSVSPSLTPSSPSLSDTLQEFGGGKFVSHL